MVTRVASALLFWGVAVLWSGAHSAWNQGDMTALRAARHEFVAAMNARDPGRVLACIAPDAVLVTHHQRIDGREAFRAVFQQLLASGMTWELSMETERLEQSGELAYELGRYSQTRRLPDGNTKNLRGTYVDVWKRQPDGRWLMIVHAPSDDPPSAPAVENK